MPTAHGISVSWAQPGGSTDLIFSNPPSFCRIPISICRQPAAETQVRWTAKAFQHGRREKIQRQPQNQMGQMTDHGSEYPEKAAGVRRAPAASSGAGGLSEIKPPARRGLRRYFIGCGQISRTEFPPFGGAPAGSGRSWGSHCPRIESPARPSNKPSQPTTRSCHAPCWGTARANPSRV